MPFISRYGKDSFRTYEKIGQAFRIAKDGYQLVGGGATGLGATTVGYFQAHTGEKWITVSLCPEASCSCP